MKKYNTVSGDTWDMVSYRLFGTEFYTNELFEANPKLQHVFIFGANQEINVPDIDTQEVELLPPWLRPESIEEQDSEALDILSGYNEEMPYILSYRFVSKFNTIVTESSKLEV